MKIEIKDLACPNCNGPVVLDPYFQSYFCVDFCGQKSPNAYFEVSSIVHLGQWDRSYRAQDK